MEHYKQFFNYINILTNMHQKNYAFLIMNYELIPRFVDRLGNLCYNLSDNFN